MLVWVIKYIGN